jgi:hypothetical protein
MGRLFLNLGHPSIFYDSAEFLFVTFSIFFDVPFDSSVGRAVDCRKSSELSLGHWFNSGSKEVLLGFPSLPIIFWRFSKEKL